MAELGVFSPFFFNIVSNQIQRKNILKKKIPKWSDDTADSVFGDLFVEMRESPCRQGGSFVLVRDKFFFRRSVGVRATDRVCP